ncbi:MAG: GHMP kinase, partial [Planctomycetota bacterium]
MSIQNSPKLPSPLKRLFSSAPVRVNDLGGWTDTWFSGTGRVLNVAVSPGIEVEIHVFDNVERRPDRVRVHAENNKASFRIDPDHPTFETEPLIEGALNMLPIPEEFLLEIMIRSGVPAGCSTGTSGSLCVALLGALDPLQSQRLRPHEIARLAHKVETEKLGLQSGIQDQLCAVYGGICFITMNAYPEAEVERVGVAPDLLRDLNASLALIYLGSAHSSTALHEEVIEKLEAEGCESSIL